MDSVVKINILEVESPWQFTARVVLPWEKEAYREAWHHWQNEMDLVEEKTIVNQVISKNAICAVNDVKDKHWHRVQVQQIHYTSRGQRARCFFVDSGDCEEYAISRLFKLPKQYHPPLVPFLVRDLTLFDLCPLSMTIELTDTGYRAPQRPCKKWDSSALSFFRDLTADCSKAGVRIKQQDESGLLHVVLFLRRGDSGDINVNELLVSKEYACYMSVGPGLETDSSIPPSCGGDPALSDMERQKQLFPPANGMGRGIGRRGGENLRRPVGPRGDASGHSSSGESHQPGSRSLANGVASLQGASRRVASPSQGRGAAAPVYQSPEGSDIGTGLPQARGALGSSDAAILSQSHLLTEASVRDAEEGGLSPKELEEVMAKVQRLKSKSLGAAQRTLQWQSKEAGAGAASPYPRPSITKSVSPDARPSIRKPLSPDPRSTTSVPLSADIQNSAARQSRGSGEQTDLLVDLSDLSDSGIFNTPRAAGSGKSDLLELSGRQPEPRQSSSLLNKFRCAQSSPEILAELLEAGSAAELKLSLTQAVASASAGLASPQGAGLSSRMSAPTTGISGMAGVKSPGAIPKASLMTPRSVALKSQNNASSAGRGRGRVFRKLVSEDFVVATQSQSPPLTPVLEPQRVWEASPAGDKPRTGTVGAADVMARVQNPTGIVSPDDLLVSGKPPKGVDSAVDLLAEDAASPCSPAQSDGQTQEASAADTQPLKDRLPLKVTKPKRSGYLSEAGFDCAAGDPEGNGFGNKRRGASQGYLSDSGAFDRLSPGKRAGVAAASSALGAAGDAAPASSEGRSTADSLRARKYDLLGADSLVGLTKEKQLGKVIGNSLLRTLEGSSSSDDQQREEWMPKVPLVWRPDRPMPDPYLGTLAFGIHLPTQCYDVEHILFHDRVKQYLLKEDFKTPWAIQAHTWPAILRGRHVIGITPGGTGKTTAYLPALITELFKFSMYHKLPRGCGAKAVILVSSCRKADAIEDYALSMLRGKSGALETTLRVLKIYGSKDQQVMPLLRGCDLLIATPHCLLRMLDNRYTFLDRLCHLVLDGAEVLLDDFMEQVGEIMERYAEKLRQYQDLPVKRQILVFGTKWTPQVADFYRAYLSDPILVFGSRLEASVYGKVKQVVHICYEHLHLSALKDLLEQLMGKEPRSIVIATSDADHVISIEKLLQSLGVYAQVIHPSADTSLEVIQDNVNRWREQAGTGSPILVVTDSDVVELGVTSAQVVVHFDLPNSKGKFGNRLALMKDNLWDGTGDMDQETWVEPVSHLLVTNTMTRNVESLHGFLEQSKTQIPPALTKLFQGMHAGKNEDAERKLCLRVLQYGRCKHENKCKDRHLILPCDVVQSDTPEAWLPATGTVKVRVLRVVDASHLFVLLLEHQVPGGEKADLQTTHASLTMELAMYMADPRNHAPFVIKEGASQLAVVKDDDDLVHRAKVMLDDDNKPLKSGSKIKVYYVDEGRSAVVRPDQLFKLTPQLQEIPPQAVEVFVCRVKPVDGDVEWTRDATSYVKERLEGKDFYGKVVLRTKQRLWLDPLVEQSRLKAIKTNVITLVVRDELLKRGLAEDNFHHIRDLYSLCEGKISIPKKLREKYFNLPMSQVIKTETFRKDEEFHDVYVSYVVSPHCFYVQKKYNYTELEYLDDELDKHMKKLVANKAKDTTGTASTFGSPVKASLVKEENLAVKGENSPVKGDNSPVEADNSPVKGDSGSGEATGGEDDPSGNASVSGAPPADQTAAQDGSTPVWKKEVEMEPGNYCLAKFAETESCHRAELLEKSEEGWRVFFIDHGEEVVVPASDVHRLPNEFCFFPAQAIQCSLAGIKPIGEDWGDDSKDVMEDLVRHVNGDKKRMMVKVLETVEAEFSGPDKHTIELYGVSEHQEVRVSEELVWNRVADSQDGEIKDMFPMVTYNSRKMYPNLNAKVHDQCAALYWMQSEEKAKLLSKQIADGIIADVKMNSSSECEHAPLQTAVMLIGYLRSCDAHSTLLSALVKCVALNPEGCGASLGFQLTLRLACCLEQVRNPVFQDQAAAACAELARIDGFTHWLDRQEIVSVACDMLLSDDPSPEMLHHISCFLTCMLTRGRNCSDIVARLEVPVALTVLDLLAETSDPETQENLLGLLSAMASWETLQGPMMREKSIKLILSVMKEPPSHQCVFYCAQICQHLCRASSRRNKRILLEEGLVLIVRDLLEGGLQSPARELCEDLNMSLAVSVPRQEVLSGVRASAQLSNNDGDVQVPLVKWSQNNFRLLLTVGVQEAKREDFTITEDRLICSCKTGSGVYGFDFELFEPVVPEKCRVEVSVTQVYLSLKKLQTGMWSRPLKEKHKCGYITVDYDKIVGSSESEVEEVAEEDNITVLSRKKKLPEFHPKEINYDFSYSENDTSDSLADFHSDERFEDPTEFVNPLDVLDDLIQRNEAQKREASEMGESGDK